jgi:hypothetical protein
LLTFGYGSGRFLSESGSDFYHIDWIRILDQGCGSGLDPYSMTLWTDWESGFRIQGMGFRMGSKFNDIVDPDPIVVNPDP